MKAQNTSKRPCDHINKEKIIAALIAKEKGTWICAEYNCGEATVSRYRKLIGVEVFNPKLSKDDIKKIIQLRPTHKIKELSKMFSVSEKYISKVYLKYKGDKIRILPPQNLPRLKANNINASIS